MQGCRAVLASARALLHVDFQQAVPAEEAWKQSGPRARGHKRRTQGLAQPAGQNGRLLPLQTCCLGCAYTAPGSLLLVEKAWADVLQSSLPPPAGRARYGS